MPDESFFADLPSETEQKPEEKKEENKERETEELRNAEIAKKEEQRRLDKVKEERELLRKKRKEEAAKLEKEKKGEEVDDEEEPEEPKPDLVKQNIEEALRERDEKTRQAELAMRVRKIAKNRQEAERIFEEVLKLPPTGDLDLDVKFATDRVQALRDRQRGFVAPSMGGGGFADMESRGTDAFGEMSAEGKQWLKNSGITAEDYKRLSGDERKYYNEMFNKFKQKK